MQIHLEKYYGIQISLDAIGKYYALNKFEAKTNGSNNTNPNKPINHEESENILSQDFSVDRKDTVVRDGKYIKCTDGTLNLTVIMSLHGREVLSYMLHEKNDSVIIQDQLEKTLELHYPNTQVLIHSDNGTEFKNKLYKEYCERTGNMQSYNNTGKAKDNASMESFFSTVEREILNGEKYSKEEVIRLFN